MNIPTKFVTTMLFMVFLFVIIYGQETISPISSDATNEYYISFQQDMVAKNIICQKDICHIQCNSDEGCISSTINASLSTQLIMDCSGYEACVSIVVSEGPTNSAHISCTNNAACREAQFYTINTLILNINCTYHNIADPTDPTVSSSCRETEFYADNVRDLSVQCVNVAESTSGSYDCYYTKFFIYNVQNAAFFLSGNLAMWKAQIHASNIGTQLSITGSGYRSFYNNDLWTPSNDKWSIQCTNSSSSCQWNDFFLLSTDGLTTDNLRCKEAFSCENIDVRCADTNSRTTIIKWSEHDTKHVCAVLPEECCPLLYTDNLVECTPDEACIIDCDEIGCPFKTYIDGSSASSLTLLCDTKNECQFATVICPRNGFCDIQCGTTRSCEYMVVTQDNIMGYMGDLSVTCIGTSCYSVDLSGLTINGDLNVECAADSSCRWMQIENVFVTGYAALKCVGSSACRDLDFYVTATDITLDCISGSSVCRSMDFIANVSNSLTILSDQRDSNSFNNADLTMSCWDCMYELINCDDNITVYCGFSNKLTPECNECVCDVSQTNFLMDFNNNFQEYCTKDPTQTPTKSPTINPTKYPTELPTIDPTKDPSQNPTKDPTNDPSSNPTKNPTFDPTTHPTAIPTIDPTNDPTNDPSNQPTTNPTSHPTFNPTHNEAAIDEVTTTQIVTTPSGDDIGDDHELNSNSNVLGQYYVYIAIGVGALYCCLIVSLFMMRYKKVENFKRGNDKKHLGATDSVQIASIELMLGTMNDNLANNIVSDDTMMEDIAEIVNGATMGGPAEGLDGHEEHGQILNEKNHFVTPNGDNVAVDTDSDIMHEIETKGCDGNVGSDEFIIPGKDVATDEGTTDDEYPVNMDDITQKKETLQ